MEKLCTVSRNNTGSWLWLRSFTPIAKFRLLLQFSSVQFSSVSQSCPTLYDPMNHSMPGLSIHHKLPPYYKFIRRMFMRWLCPSWKIDIKLLTIFSKLMNTWFQGLESTLILFAWQSNVLCLVIQSFRFSATPSTVAHQLPLSMGILQGRILESVAMLSFVETSSTSRVSESAMWRENAKWDTRIQRKTRIRGPTPLPRWRCRKWIQASFIILSAITERICGELNYNSCGLQGQRTKWSLTIE